METAYGILGQTAVRMHGKMNEDWATGQVQNVLGILLVRPGERVPATRIMTWAWDDELPANPKDALYKAVNRLRRALADADLAAPVETVDGGYRIALDPNYVDLAVFHEGMREARAAADAGNHESAYESAHAALSLWRGEPLAGLQTGPVQNWRRNTILTQWIPACSFLVHELLTLHRPETAARELDRLLPEHAGELTFVKLRTRVFYALQQFTQGQEYFLGAYREFRDAGDEPAADELRAFHDRLRETHRSTPAPGNLRPVTSAPQVRPLPRDLRGFTGRADVLGALNNLLLQDNSGRSAPAVVLTGPPGMGKTSAALHWAHGVAEAFPRGRVYVDLQGFGPAPRLEHNDVVDLLLDEFGFPVDHVVRESDRAAVLREHLAERQVLVVLDNAENSDHVDRLLDLLADSTLLITSRRRLKALARKYELPTLSLGYLDDHDSLALLTRRIHERAEREPDAARRIAHLCDGLPLALSLVAERAAERPGLSLSMLLGQLRDPEMLLSIGDNGDDESLRTTFSSSYRTLDPAGQAVFRLFGHHPGAEMQADTVLSAAGLATTDTRRALETLVALHLIDQPGDTDRFRIPSIFHRYAQTLSEHDHDQVPLRRLLSHYTRTAENAHRIAHPHGDRPPIPEAEPGTNPTRFETPEAATRWFLQERTNIAALAAKAEHARLFDYVCLLAHLVGETLSRFGYYAERIAGLTAAARAAQARGDLIAEGSTFNDLGYLHLTLCDEQAAAPMLVRALELATAVNHPIAVLTVNINLARQHRLAGRHTEAITLFRKCVVDAQSARDPVREAKSEQYLGDLLAELDQSDRALPHFHRALHLRTLLGDTPARIETHIALAELHYAQEDLPATARHCAQARTLLDGTAELTAGARLRTVQARLAKAEHNDRAALRLSQEAVELAERAHTATGQAHALEAFAEILHALGNSPDAVDAWTRAAAFYRGRGQHGKAERLEAHLAEIGPPHEIPEARDGESTVAMPSPRRSITSSEQST
ncbi:putative ATPase [Amycolatopsis sulphurea]|uniref:Putative ATPase n=1 Tax=Amycolatopsis sulphurea TaxID=76022 RepID=A0A2A9F7I8_9PSEU|nr:BTAD domain-containing putative transcriptional regulator [Amycolatopsis sulphurea]PFG46460.1 putative ATPase [Amycolatopsis sulphurea]